MSRAGWIPHPGMLVALVDGTGFLQHRDRPAAHRAARWPSLLHRQHRIGSCPGQILSCRPLFRLLPQGRDSEMLQRGFSSCSARHVDPPSRLARDRATAAGASPSERVPKYVVPVSSVVRTRRKIFGSTSACVGRIHPFPVASSDTRPMGTPNSPIAGLRSRVAYCTRRGPY